MDIWSSFGECLGKSLIKFESEPFKSLPNPLTKILLIEIDLNIETSVQQKEELTENKDPNKIAMLFEN